MNRTLLADVADAVVTPASAPAREPADRNLAVGYLRAFVTLLVVAHHAVLAYVPFAPPAGRFDQPPYLWAAFPIVDPAKFGGFQELVMLNDLFFMSLMFFIAGLFTPASLARKGTGTFLRDRLMRLGLPFLICALFLSPLAYYPAYASRTPDASLAGYAQAWLALPGWRSGPAWFLWVLMALGLAAAAIQRFAPGALARLGRLAAGSDARPGRFLLGLTALSALAYGLMLWVFEPNAWVGFGPFAIQGVRMLQYPLYFFAGIALGVHGLERGLLAPGGALARRIWTWRALATAGFVGVLAVVVASGAAHGQPVLLWRTLGAVGFAVTCAGVSFAVMAMFRRHVKRRRAIFDSLSANAYGIYLVHYVFVAWVQWALLPQAMGGLEKGLIAFAGATALSWATAALLRRLPGVSSIL